MESSSAMSFKLPVKVINKYKDKLPKKSSFKKSLTDEIKKMCNLIRQIKDYSLILEQATILEKEPNVNKRYVVTEVDNESGQLLKDFRNKYDVTQSALLWFWLENDGKISKGNLIENTEANNKKPADIKTVHVTKVEKGSVSGVVNNKSENAVKYSTEKTMTSSNNNSSSNISKLQKLLVIQEYDGPTEDLVVELPTSTIENFKSTVPDNISIEKAMQDEIRKMCKLVYLSKERTTIASHVKRIEKYKTEKVSIVVKIDPNSMNVLNSFNDSYGTSKSGLIWLWLSMDDLKYSIFKID